MRNLIYIPVLIVLVTLGSCSKCGNRVGDLTSKTVSLDSFHSINIDGAFNVKLVQDSSSSIKIQSGEGLVENVYYEVYKDTLRVRNDNKCDFLRNYKGGVDLTIGIGEIKKIELLNPKQFSCMDSLYSDQLDLLIKECGIELNLVGNFNRLKVTLDEGTPTAVLRGKSNIFTFVDNSYGQLNAFDLQTRELDLFAQGTGILEVQATDSLSAKLNGSNLLYYKGNPAKTNFDIQKHANAQIIKAD